MDPGWERQRLVTLACPRNEPVASAKDLSARPEDLFRARVNSHFYEPVEPLAASTPKPTERKYCICRKRYDASDDSMIGCDDCNECVAYKHHDCFKHFLTQLQETIDAINNGVDFTDLCGRGCGRTLRSRYAFKPTYNVPIVVFTCRDVRPGDAPLDHQIAMRESYLVQQVPEPDFKHLARETQTKIDKDFGMEGSSLTDNLWDQHRQRRKMARKTPEYKEKQKQKKKAAIEKKLNAEAQ
ncbi:unnamed protein product [Allacma fusca]|uniref:Uncharacterized protein n=1 Tax=Allacma fusca TaxID=39272 RepID=A0A8J2KHY6_9HEXA|nr:unnamed protein product [Allacma fusca]